MTTDAKWEGKVQAEDLAEAAWRSGRETLRDAPKGQLLNAQGAAARLNVKVDRVYEWARNGDLPKVRLPGRLLRFDPEELDRWIKDRVTTAVDPTVK